MAVGGDGGAGGVAQREGVDLSCQTLAPRGGAPSLPPRPPVRAPRCPIEIAGFGVVSLCSLHPFFFFVSTALSRPPIARSLATLRASVLHLALLSRLSLVHRSPRRTASGATMVRPRTFSHPRGWLSKLSFETCTFVARALARATSHLEPLHFNHILVEVRTWKRTSRATWNSFSRDGPPDGDEQRDPRAVPTSTSKSDPCLHLPLSPHLPIFLSIELLFQSATSFVFLLPSLP